METLMVLIMGAELDGCGVKANEIRGKRTDSAEVHWTWRTSSIRYE